MDLKSPRYGDFEFTPFGGELILGSADRQNRGDFGSATDFLVISCSDAKLQSERKFGVRPEHPFPWLTATYFRY